MKKLFVKPKMALGGLVDTVGMIVQGFVDYAETQKQKEADIAALAEQEKLKKIAEEKQSSLKNFQQYQVDANNNFPKYGFVSVPSYYAYGGEMPGGFVKSLATGIAVAKGATHESGGIDLGDVNIEDEEVIVGSMVFSNRIPYKGTTVAKHAQKLGKMKGTFDSVIKENKKDRFKTSDALRKNESIEKEINDLFNYQEKFKEAMGLVNPGNTGKPKMSLGGKMKYNKTTGQWEYIGVDEFGNPIPDNSLSSDSGLEENFVTKVSTEPPTKSTKGEGFDWAGAGESAMDLVKNVAPYVDNLVNANLIKKLPQIPKPILQPTVKLDRISPDQQLLEIDKTGRDTRNFISRNTSSSNVSNAVANNVQAGVIGEKNKIMSDVNEKNAMLDFREKWLNKDITGSNVATLNENQLMKMQRDWEKNRMQADNWVNAIEDFKLQQNESDQKELDALKIRLTASMDSTGSFERSIKSEYDKATASGDKNTVRLLKQIFPEYFK